jgi:hypothetical protein
MPVLVSNSDYPSHLFTRIYKRKIQTFSHFYSIGKFKIAATPESFDSSISFNVPVTKI